METFSEPRDLVEHPRYGDERRAALDALDLAALDPPLVDVIQRFVALPHCFTLQCCWGHFVCSPEQAPDTLDPIPAGHPGPVRYRIAYIALCVQNGRSGRALLDSLQRLTAGDPEYLQLGSAKWFWERWPNSYAVQVEPWRHRERDEAILPIGEALRVQDARNRFFTELRTLLADDVRCGLASR